MRHIRFTLIRLMGLACLGLSSVGALADNGATTVYRWVDAQGVVHYSDQPHPNAQKLEIRGAQTFSALPAGQAASGDDDSSQTQSSSQAAYESCTIAQPADQQMLMNVYQATAVVQTSPGLRSGDEIRLFLDGKQMQGSGPSYTFPVDRGQHSVQAVIQDSTGQIVCETSSVTFFVHQPSVQNPHNPVHPH